MSNKQNKPLQALNPLLAATDTRPDTLNAMAELASTLKEHGNLLGARMLQESVLNTRRRLMEEFTNNGNSVYQQKSLSCNNQ